PPTAWLRLHGRAGAARQRARAGCTARAAGVPGTEPRPERRVPSRARRARDRSPRVARLGGAARRGCALPRDRGADRPGPGSGGVRPAGGRRRQLRLARRAAGGRAARVDAMIRRLVVGLTLVTASGMVACAEWAGSELGGPTLSFVPLIAIGTGTGAAQPVTVPVSYVGPCRIGSGCVVTVAPQDTTLTPGGSFVMRVSVDSALILVTGVPVALTNLTPGLILVGPDRTVTALLSPTGGPARVEAAIRGSADTLRLTVAPLTAPAAVLVNPGYVTLTTLSPGNTAQLTAVVTDIAGKPLSSSLATWSSRTPSVATVSSTGLVTGVAAGSAIVAAMAAPGVADSLVVMVGDALTPPGSPIALALVGGRSFGVGKVAQPMAIDVVVDLKAVPTELLGSYDARLTWNAGVLRFDSTQAGSFVFPVVSP